MPTLPAPAVMDTSDGDGNQATIRKREEGAAAAVQAAGAPGGDGGDKKDIIKLLIKSNLSTALSCRELKSAVMNTLKVSTTHPVTQAIQITTKDHFKTVDALVKASNDRPSI